MTQWLNISELKKQKIISLDDYKKALKEAQLIEFMKQSSQNILENNKPIDNV